MFNSVSRSQDSGVFVHNPYVPDDFTNTIQYLPVTKRHLVVIYPQARNSVITVWDVKEQRQVYLTSVSQNILHACAGVTETTVIFVGSENQTNEKAKVSLFRMDLMVGDPELIDVRLDAEVTNLVALPSIKACLLMYSSSDPLIFRFDTKRESTVPLPLPPGTQKKFVKQCFNAASNLMCVVTSKNRVFVFDLSNPDKPRLVSSDISSDDEITSIAISGSSTNPVVVYCTARKMIRTSLYGRSSEEASIDQAREVSITDDSTKILLSTGLSSVVYSKDLRALDKFETRLFGKTDILDSQSSQCYIIYSGNLYSWDLSKQSIERPTPPSFLYPKIEDAWMHNNVQCELATPLIMVNAQNQVDEGFPRRLLSATNGRAAAPTLLEGLFSFTVESVQIGPDTSMWIAYDDILCVSTQYERGALDVKSMEADKKLDLMYRLPKQQKLKVKFVSVSPFRNNVVTGAKIGYFIAVAFEGDSKVSIYKSMDMKKPLFEIPIDAVQACAFSKSANTLVLVQKSGRTLFFDIKKRLTLPLKGSKDSLNMISISCFWQSAPGKYVEIKSDNSLKEVDRLFFDCNAEHLTMSSKFGTKLFKITNSGVKPHGDVTYGAEKIANFPKCPDLQTGHFLVGLSTGMVLVDYRTPNIGKLFYEWAQGEPLSICASKDGEKVYAIGNSGVTGIWNRRTSELEGYMAILAFEDEVVLYFTSATGDQVDIPGGRSKYKYVTCAEHFPDKLPLFTQKLPKMNPNLRNMFNR